MTNTPQPPKKSPFTTKLFGANPLRPEDSEAVEAVAREWAEDQYRQEANVRSTIPAEAATPGEFLAYCIESAAAMFDVHGKRIAIIAVEDPRACEESLDRLIQHYQAICAPAEGRFGFSRRHIASEVGIKLKQRKAHWMAEALRLSRKVESAAQFQDQIEKGQKVLEEARQTLEAFERTRVAHDIPGSKGLAARPAEEQILKAAAGSNGGSDTKAGERTILKRRRGPDVDKHKERKEFEDTLISELGTIRERIAKQPTLTLKKLRESSPSFKLWTFLSDTEQQELIAEEFEPRAYARNLTLRKFGIREDALKRSLRLAK